MRLMRRGLAVLLGSAMVLAASHSAAWNSAPDQDVPEADSPDRVQPQQQEPAAAPAVHSGHAFQAIPSTDSSTTSRTCVTVTRNHSCYVPRAKIGAACWCPDANSASGRQTGYREADDP